MRAAVKAVIAGSVLFVMLTAGALPAEERSVDLGNASSASVRVKMGGDTLKISAGAEALMNGDFNYNPKAPPEISYKVENSRGFLVITQGSLGAVSKRVGNDWEIRLNHQIPLELAVDFSTGTCSLNLEGLNLTGLSVNAFSGDVSVELPSSYPQLPRLEAKMDYGNLAVMLKGEYPSLAAFNVELTSGILNLDLTGNWRTSVTGTINSGNATTTMNLPRDVGVRVEVKNHKVVTESRGLKMQENGVYVNDAYGTAPVTLRLVISNRKGKVALEVEE